MQVVTPVTILAAGLTSKALKHAHGKTSPRPPCGENIAVLGGGPDFRGEVRDDGLSP